MKAKYHIVPNKSNEWSVKKEGSTRASATAHTQKGAYDIAKTFAQNTNAEIVIHGRNGQIRNPNSFGNDPCPPKDKKH